MVAHSSSSVASGFSIIFSLSGPQYNRCSFYLPYMVKTLQVTVQVLAIYGLLSG